MPDATRAHTDGAPAAAIAPAGELYYLFALSATEPTASRHPPEAEFETELSFLRVGAVTALVGMVPAAEYCGAGGDLNMTDIAWLAPRLRRHAAMIDWVMQEAAVFPAPFGTLYVSFDSLSRFIRRHETAITDFLGAVAGKREWELRVFAQLDGAETLNRMAAARDPDWSALAPGKRYMQLSRDKPALIEAGRDVADMLVTALAADLQQMSADLRRLDTGTRRDDAGAALVARYAFLVDERGGAAFRARIGHSRLELARNNVTLTLLGPWPPFSFRPDLPHAPRGEQANA